MDCKENSGGHANSRINKFIEKSLIWIIGAVFSIGVAAWNKMDTEVDALQEKVAFLYQDKVSRQELKDEMFLVRNQIEKDYQQLRGEILGRLDFILKLSTPTPK